MGEDTCGIKAYDEGAGCACCVCVCENGIGVHACDEQVVHNDAHAICLADNELGAEGIMALGPAIESLPGLTSLNIACEWTRAYGGAAGVHVGGASVRHREHAYDGHVPLRCMMSPLTSLQATLAQGLQGLWHSYLCCRICLA